MIYQHACDIVTDDIFLELEPLAPESRVFLKLEGMNPAGSIKLKAALGMVDDAERRHLLPPDGRIVESTSGNLGIALAVIAASRGYHFTCVTDPNVSPHSLSLMRALGADIVQVSRPDGNGGFLGTRIARIRQMLDEDPGLLWLNQYANRANVDAHATRTAPSILKNIGHVDTLLVGAGTTGTLMGCVRHFRAFSPWTRIVAVDTTGSVTFGGTPGPRHLPGLGTSRQPELCRRDAVDEVVFVDEPEAVRTCRCLARKHGLPLGGSTGSVVAAVEKLGPEATEDSRIVAVSPDMADRYIETVYDDGWVEDTFGADPLSPEDVHRVFV